MFKTTSKVMLILVCWIRLSLGNMLSNLYNFCGREDCWMLMSQLSNVFPDLLDHRSLHFEAKFDKLRSVEMTQFRHAGLDACKSQHESLIRVLPKSERLSLECPSTLMWWQWSHRTWQRCELVIVVWPFWGGKHLCPGCSGRAVLGLRPLAPVVPPWGQRGQH